jgi:heme O synthase-like polyprenyltransferase
VLFARVLGLLVATGLGALLLMYLLSGERRYLRYAWRLFKYALFLLVFVLLLIFGERLVSQF